MFDQNKELTFMSIYSKKIPLFLPFVVLSIVYIVGLFIDLMDVDATQYATMSRQMLDTGNWLQVYNREENYLDKPPLVFWLSAFTYKILGVSVFAYRLPSFLFTILAVFSTYKFAKLFYSEPVAYTAALMLASCQAFFLFNHDVRTDTLQTGALIFAIWQLAAFTEKGKFQNLILGFFGVGLAMLAKGMLGLMMPAMAFSIHFIIRREWKNFFRWEWLVGVLVLAVVLFPMCIGLYEQHGWNGIKFFFWSQSFGRITGENEWENGADLFFLMHTFLWSYLPWSLLFLAALFMTFKVLFQKKLKIEKGQEAITFGGFLLPYIALSLSKYQLPHYIFILYPLVSVITAKYTIGFLVSIKDHIKPATPWTGIQGFVIFVLWILIGLLILVCFPLTNVLIWAVVLLFFLGSLFLLFNKKFDYYTRIVLSSTAAIAGGNFALNAYVYPTLFAFQSERVASNYVQTLSDEEKKSFYWYKEHQPSLDFYSYKVVPNINQDLFSKIPDGKIILIYTTKEGLGEIKNWSKSTEILKEYDHFHVSTLTLPFLNPNTRKNETEKRYLLRIKK